MNIPRVRFRNDSQMGADRHVKSEWLTIEEFSIIFFYKSFLSILELFCAER